MMEVIITTEDAQAVVNLLAYCEHRFQVVNFPPAGKIPRPGEAATGEPYVELTGKEWQPSRDAVIELARKTFDEYADGKTGTLFWRVRPEIAKDHQQGWKFYMRLLISDKEVK